MEAVTQKVVFVGQVIEDVTYMALEPGRFMADLLGVGQIPQYKQGGFFVFSDLPARKYTLRVSGERFQTWEYYDVPIPWSPFPFGRPGDNDLVVVVKELDNCDNKISFDPVILPQAINAGAAVLARDISTDPPAKFATKLAKDLDPGRVVGAKLADTSGLTVGAIVRIVRADSIRLRFDPYAQLPAQLTRIIGKVTARDAPERGLRGAEVRLTAVQGTSVTLTDIEGARIATAAIGGKRIVLGAENDITATANQRGDYNLYFGQGLPLAEVTLEATLAGYAKQPVTKPITAGRRNPIDIELAPA